jgi:predicted ArsR family transcriptional regulator
MTTPFNLPRDPDHIAGVLSDERRRSIYLHVARSHGPLTVNEVAEQFQIHRNAAKFHLDKLLDAGLLRAEFRRLNGRRGPGAGRPSKLYSPTEEEISFSAPERHYDLLAHLLLQALTSGADIETVGYRFGDELATTMAPDLEGHDTPERVRIVLDRLGFRPSVEQTADGSMFVTTENCPFGRVAMEAPDGEVCRLDRAIVRGILEHFGGGCVDVCEHTSVRLGHDLCIREVVARDPVS